MAYGEQHHSSPWIHRKDPLVALHEQLLRSDPELEETVLSDSDVFALLKSGKQIPGPLPASLHTSKSKETISSFSTSSPTDNVHGSQISALSYSPSDSTYGSHFSQTETSQTTESTYSSVMSTKRNSSEDGEADRTAHVPKRTSHDA